MNFFLFGNKNKLIIFVFIRFIINNNNKNTIYIAFIITNKIKKSYLYKINI